MLIFQFRQLARLTCEFDAFGNVCLVRRSADSEAASPEARELFRRSQLLQFRRLSTQL